MKKKLIIICGAVVVLAIAAFAFYISKSQPAEPLPKQVMTTVSNAKYGDLWLQYLSYKDSIGSAAQFQEYLKSHKITERQLAHNILVQIIKQKGIKGDASSIADACINEEIK